LSTRNVIPDTVLQTEARNIAAIAIQSGSREPLDSLSRKIYDSLNSLFDNTLGATDVALMIVWCFLAGFSEQLVPKLLTNTESKLNPPDLQPTKGSDKDSGDKKPNIPGPQSSDQLSGNEIPGGRSGNVSGREEGKPAPESTGAVNSSEAPSGTANSGLRQVPRDREQSEPPFAPGTNEAGDRNLDS
ncbi:MAG: hypothetical protein ACRERU_03625, partial [Methylococcales bacterium]